VSITGCCHLTVQLLFIVYFIIVYFLWVVVSTVVSTGTVYYCEMTFFVSKGTLKFTRSVSILFCFSETVHLALYMNFLELECID